MGDNSEKRGFLHLFGDTSTNDLADLFFEETGSANMIVDADTTLLRVNAEFERLTGYSRKQVEGVKSWTELVYPPDLPRMIENHKLRREHPEKAQKSYEYRFVAADGSLRWGFLTAGVLPDGRRTIVSVVDVTELKNKEEELKRSEELYSGIVQTQTELISRFTPDFVLTFVNDAYCRYYDQTRENLIGKSFAGHALPEDSEKQKAYFSTLTPENPVNDVEERTLLPSGEIRWQHWFDKGIFDPEGKLVEIQSSGRDVTERKQMEAELEESNARFMNLFRQSSAIMLLIDPEDGRIIDSNDQALEFYGYSLDDIRNMTITQINRLTPEQVKAEMEHAREMSRNHFVFPHGLADGSIRTVEVYSGPVKWRGRTILYSIIHDITERKKMERDLEAAYGRLDNAFRKTIEMTGRIIEVRDPYTAGHQRRVALLARRIAEEMGLSENSVESVYYAGLVHDVGKIYVPSEILSKPGRLMESEWMLIRQHPLHSGRILEDLDLPWPVARIARSHHERLDGSGYPQGLAGDEICIEARILTVADVVEAMASNRPYRPPLGIETALEEITANRGKIYDPDAVDVCVSLFREKAYAFESETPGGIL